MKKKAIFLPTPLTYFEAAYERAPLVFSPSPSLVVLAKLCQRRWGEDFFSGRWIELGTGLGSTFEGLEVKPDAVLGLDFSAVATRKARARGLPFIEFQTARLDMPWPAAYRGADGILDAHLLHCLEGEEAIGRALAESFEALKPGGVLVGEVMVFGRQFVADEGLTYGPSHGLICNARGLVIHTLLDSLRWERLLLKAGFEIFYFEVFSHLRFIHNPKREELLKSDPEVLRFIAKRRAD